MSEYPKMDLLEDRPKVINVGLEDFARDLSEQGIETVHVEWSPPADGDPKLAAILAKLGA